MTGSIDNVRIDSRGFPIVEMESVNKGVAKLKITQDPNANTKEEKVEASTFQIIGGNMLSCYGLAPRPRLQNILGDHWPSPPLAIDHVSYVYMNETEISNINSLAKEYKATFRSEQVRVDGNRCVSLCL